MVLAKAICAGIACAIGSACFAGIVESEPNDSISTADEIGSIEDLIIFISGSISPGDVDFFQAEMPAGVPIWAFLDDGNPNVLIGLFSSDGSLLATNRDLILIGSLVMGGTYYLGITATQDIDLVGEHDLAFDYTMMTMASVFPAPSTLPLLAMAVLAGRSRRRRRSR